MNPLASLGGTRQLEGTTCTIASASPAKGYVVPEMGGWAAGAVDGEVGVVVSVSGKNAKEDAAVALLQETIRRRKP
jgi:uncharacterized protein GlcG (DUF336 family)